MTQDVLQRKEGTVSTSARPKFPQQLVEHRNLGNQREDFRSGWDTWNPYLLIFL